MKLRRPDFCEGLKDASACANCCEFDCVWNTQLWLRWRLWCLENGVGFGILHCRDCKWFQDGFCTRPDGCGGHLRFEAEPDGFCAWGEEAGDGPEA